MRRSRDLLVVVLCTVLVAALAWAASPHFLKATAAIDTDGTLTVSWKEAGLGDTALITYTVTASADAFYQCVNHGGNCPSAANKESIITDVSATGTFSSGKNGNIVGSLSIEPPPSTLDCPGNQVAALGSVSYSGISLSDDTNSLSTATVPSSLAVELFKECP